MLFHPNIIILWLSHNWNGVWELVIDLHMQIAMFGSILGFAYIAIDCDLLILVSVCSWCTPSYSNFGKLSSRVTVH